MVLLAATVSHFPGCCQRLSQCVVADKSQVLQEADCQVYFTLTGAGTPSIRLWG